MVFKWNSSKENAQEKHKPPIEYQDLSNGIDAYEV